MNKAAKMPGVPGTSPVRALAALALAAGIVPAAAGWPQRLPGAACPRHQPRPRPPASRHSPDQYRRAVTRPGLPAAPMRRRRRPPPPRQQRSAHRRGVHAGRKGRAGSRASPLLSCRRSSGPLFACCCCCCGALLPPANDDTPPAEAAAKAAAPSARASPAKTATRSCLQRAAKSARRRGRSGILTSAASGCVLSREHTVLEGESLPAWVRKDWRSLFKRKLNIAWLPPEQRVPPRGPIPAERFSRDAGDGGAAAGETLAHARGSDRLEHPHPAACRRRHADGDGDDRVARGVEEFLGKLEGQGYLADRLELPLLDQLQATAITEDGAWIYPEVGGSKNYGAGGLVVRRGAAEPRPAHACRGRIMPAASRNS